MINIPLIRIIILYLFIILFNHLHKYVAFKGLLLNSYVNIYKYMKYYTFV